MPDVISREDAHGPNDDRKRRLRAEEWQQPEEVPRIDDRCTKERCCHRPSEVLRRPFGGASSHPDRGKKSDEHCHSSSELWSRQLLKDCKHRIIEAETAHIGAERTERNPSVIEKRDVEEPENECCERAVAHTNTLPVEWEQNNREQFHCNRQPKCQGRNGTPAAAQRRDGHQQQQ